MTDRTSTPKPVVTHQTGAKQAALLAGLVLVLCTLITPALAADTVNDTDQDQSTETPAELSPMVIVSTRTPRKSVEVSGSVEVIDATMIDQHLSHDMSDVLRYFPGIDTVTDSTRFRNTGFNIRGIGGNRVAIEVDGVPVSDHFSIGNFSNAGRNLIDPAVLKRIEILRGPASALYGSDAIAGVIAYSTFLPQDLVGRTGERYTRVASSYHDVDGSLALSLTAAGAGTDTGWLVSATARHGHEPDNSRVNLPDDTQDYSSHQAMARFTANSIDRGDVILTLDQFRSQTDTDIHSLLGLGRFRSTTALTGDDESSRDRVSLSWDMPFYSDHLEQANLLLYHQRSDTDQFTVEERASRNLKRERSFHYDQDVSGLKAIVSTSFSSGQSDHRLSMGGDFVRSTVRESRNALQTDLLTGVTTRNILGEVFPVRDFPISRIEEIGLFIQDEISLADGRWQITPALRYDNYRLDPRRDSIYVEDHPDSEIVSLREHNVSPKLSWLYHSEPGSRSNWQLYGQFSRGFRAPPFEDANIGLDIPLFNIRAIPNPDLESETSDTVEIGYRMQGKSRTFDMTAHYSEFDDFIDTKVNLGPDPDSGVILFQSQNIEQARIYGVDLSFTQSLSHHFENLDTLDLWARAAWTRGDNRVNNQPLNSIFPAEAVIGIDWQATTMPASLSLMGTFVTTKNRIDNSNSELFSTPGYATFDLTGRYDFNRNATLRAGLFNLGDRRYWRWGNVQGFAADDPLTDVMSSPGRHLAISLDVVF